MITMKYIKHINEGWIEKIEKILPNRAKHVTTRIKESVERIFNQYIKNPLVYKVVVEEEKEFNLCHVRVLTKLDDDFGDGLTYLFNILVKDGIIYFKAVGYSGYHIKDFYEFHEINYPIGYEEDLDAIIEQFAEKANGFVNYMISLDDE
jgi:hypothetical protein